MVELYIILGIVIGGILVFLLMKSLYVSKKSVEALNEKLIRSQENENYSLQKIEELKLSNNQLKDDINLIQRSKEELLFTNAELNAHYKNLQENLENQKSEFLKLQETTRLHFEKTANQILEEKSEKFTQLNQNQLKTILEPFQEKINELKNTVNETYDKEAKERFSLGEKVRELKDLNQQISEDARQLTRALKGESKTQGNWGEMILESILEKSGLRKNQEYFMEHELRDENNKAIFSEFSGKKCARMRW